MWPPSRSIALPRGAMGTEEARVLQGIPGGHELEASEPESGDLRPLFASSKSSSLRLLEPASRGEERGCLPACQEDR